MNRVVILGSGISGLSAAHTLLKHSKIPCQITILEAQSKVGGRLESTRFDDGTVFEHGPRSFRKAGGSSEEALNMISELNIDKEIVGVPTTRGGVNTRYIYVNGKIQQLPSSLKSVVFKQEPFSKSLLSSGVKEIFTKKNVNEDDESVHSFFSRRFNIEIANYLANPLCRGIYGGDSHKLSINSCFPFLVDYEKDHGSVVKGLLFSKAVNVEEESILTKRAKSEKWLAWSLKDGLQALPTLWANNLTSRGVDIRLNTRCNQLTFKDDNTVECATDTEIFKADRVISAISSCDLSPVLSEHDKKLSELLKRIEYVSMAVINLEYKITEIPIKGYGVLVPSTEPIDVLGITMDSLVIPEHSSNSNNTVVVGVMAGGAWFEDIFGCPESVDTSKISELAIKSLRDMIGMKGEPTKVDCTIQKYGIPQYNIGHNKKVEEIKSYLDASNLPLSVVGNGFEGVSMNDCIINSRNETLKWLSSNT